MGFLAGKRILLTGLLSNRSIAYGIAQACKREGAELAFTYVGDRFKDRITEFATEFGSNLVFPCDVGDDAQIDGLFTSLKQHWDSLDGLVHYYVGIDRVRGALTNVSVWDSLDHAHQMDTLPAMLAQRPILEAAGVSFQPITNHETLWVITP